ncbi:thioredoxin [bacterium]|jgi:thioredoxin 1|nr:thioredoxin [bacterium]MBT3581524.1 thioredoxin [bacterium]MBT4551520.1 thioredoxin [bacterium]MBT5988512.1 thioredoxin [bacterium]MBT7087528.1 thioredoxin [bacterium]
MLDTNIKQLETEEDVKKVITENENVMICCGRMGPMCIPVYGIMEELKKSFSHVKFHAQSFDIPGAMFIKKIPECSSFRGLPFTVYFKNGEVVAATTSIQTKEQVIEILEQKFKA